MTLYGLWWGGPSYSRPTPDDDLERLHSLSAAKEALRDRYHSNGCRTEHFDFIEREPEQVYLPAVTTDSEIWLYASPDSDPACPDWRVYFGPRAGVRVERC
ncbi:hypothetical protein [Actinomadura rupiterrae]|uniref:hypothetical protein n=1 Tax=Actinomadura rupiterrae TaxID=559627 RepID=UPI0020A4D851|nr:hypothetical protein [Actinomadura rupiterrae]MCP2337502.1 hypothetical protein [Actinomadura rupiterrae]